MCGTHKHVFRDSREPPTARVRSRCARQCPGGVDAGKEKEETQYVILTREDEVLYMIWAKEEEKTHAQVSGRE